MSLDLKKLVYMQKDYERSIKKLKSLCNKILSLDIKNHYLITMTGWEYGIELDEYVVFKSIELQFKRELKRYMDSYNTISNYVKINDELNDLVKEVKNHLKNIEKDSCGLFGYTVINYKVEEQIEEYPF